MAELLLEILSEEIPARMQGRAADDLQRLVLDALAKAGMEHGEARSFVTPRRLALVIEDLPERQPDVTEERKGPRVGAPEKAVEGFLRANGLTSIDEAEVREGPKGASYFLTRHIPGKASQDVLPELLSGVVTAFVWPKSMRWGRHRQRWVRPLHGVLAVFGGRALVGTLDLGAERHLEFGNSTVGHRFLAPESFETSDFADYERKLRAAKVMLDPAERREAVEAESKELVASEGLAIKADGGLLSEVVGLVEWPKVLMGTISETFMDLPPEVLSTAMRAHQKYFSVEREDGQLANRFLLVSNMDATAGSDLERNILSGNERVLSARLSDARFFWDQDRASSLASRVPALDDIVFHAKLGTLAEKVSRIQSLAVSLSDRIAGADRDRVRSAARLSKADLVTEMVGEFPELQGTMGRYYAINDGEHPEVCDAIAEHYAPQGPGDDCPSAPVSVAVALADKVDTLAGFWAIDEKPTGSKDPFALRRAALGVIRLVVENGLRMPLADVFRQAQQAYTESALKLSLDSDALVEDLLSFLAERMKVALRDKGVRHDLISSVFAVRRDDGQPEDDLVRLLARVDALQGFIESDDGANLLVAYRRAANIVRIESKKDKRAFDSSVDEALLEDKTEKALHQSLGAAQVSASEALQDERYAEAMVALAQLRGPVDAFFEAVMVNVESTELRENRLRLLSAIDSTLSPVADFSRIEG